MLKQQPGRLAGKNILIVATDHDAGWLASTLSGEGAVVACVNQIEYAFPTLAVGRFAASLVSFRVAALESVLRFIGLVQQPHPVVVCHAPSISAVVAAGRNGAADAVDGLDRDGREVVDCLWRVLAGRRQVSWTAGTLNNERSLTDRERQVLTLIVSGRTSKQAADELGISARTVEVHRLRLMKKLGASNVAHLVRIVLGTGSRSV